MLPFVRMIEYGNIAPSAPELKSFKGWGAGYPLFSLYSNGELYGIGQSYTSFGDGVNAVYNDWHLIRRDVDEIYTGYRDSYYTLIKTKDGKYYVTGGRSSVIFPGSGYPYDVNFFDITSNMVLPDNSAFKHIDFDGYSIFAISENNDLFATGNFNYYSNGSSNSRMSWTKIMSNVKMVSRSDEGYFTWITTLDNKVFRAGTNTRFTLIRGTSGTATLTTFTEYVPTVPYKSAYCVGYKVYFQDINNKIYVIGSGDSDASMGNGNTGTMVYTPESNFSTLADLPSTLYYTSGNTYNTFILNGSTVKYAGYNQSGNGGTGLSRQTTFTNVIGIPPITSTDEFTIIVGRSTSYIRYYGSVWGAGRGAYIYGNTNGGFYINEFVPMKLPKD